MVVKHVVVSRIKPPTIRKNVIVQRTVRVITEPSKPNSQLNQLQYQAAQQLSKPKVLIVPKSKVIPPSIQRPSPQIVINRKLLKDEPHRKTPRFISSDVTPQSLTKIKALRYVGVGRVLVIIGNGPSINEAPLGELKHPLIDTMSINRPDSRLWPTTYWGFCDPTQFKRNEGLWNDYNGVIINSTAIKKQKPKSLQVKNLGDIGFSKDPTQGFFIGRSTVYAMMQIALWMNYEKVYIFGVDMNSDGLNGMLHFYGVNPDVKDEQRGTRFVREAKSYDHAATVLTENERDKFVFCSDYNPWPFITKFGHMSHKTAVKTILDRVTTSS